MGENTGGDSVATASGDTTTAPVSTETKDSVSTPQKEDSKPTGEVDDTGKSEGTLDHQYVKDLEKKTDEAHRQMIELIEDKFNEIDTGKLSKTDLQTWFDEHPSIADKANRSKRVKDRFRELMEFKPEKSTSADDEKPITKADLVRFQQESEARAIERTLTRERETKAEEYAVQYNIKDAEYDRLKSTATVLAKANPEWEWETALKAAHRALTDDKGTPINLSGTSVRQETRTASTPVDAGAGWIPAVSKEAFGIR